MGCICGKPIVRASISKIKVPKEKSCSSEPSNIISQPLQETSNESDRILIQQKQIKTQQKSVEFEIVRKSLFFSSFTQLIIQPLERPEKNSMKLWQSVLKSFDVSAPFSLKPVQSSLKSILTEWDEILITKLTRKILELPERNWISEQIDLLSAQKSEKKHLKLKNQFQWLLWAVRNVWLVFITGKSSKVGVDYEKLTGYKTGVPESPEHWTEGFIYKNVRFVLAFQGSETAKKLKNELKSMKNLYLDSLKSKISLFFPLLQGMSLGPYILFSVPVYPEGLLLESENLEINLMTNPKLNIPKANVFKISIPTPVYLVQDCYSLAPLEQKRSLILTFNAESQNILVSENIYEGSLTKKDVTFLLYNCQKPDHKIRIKQSIFSLYGWDCFVFWDGNYISERLHMFSEFFGGIYGNFLVVFNESFLKAKRNMDFHYNKQNNSSFLKSSLKECINALELKESINSQDSLEELLHRKGLRGYHQWIIYSKCRSQRTAALLESSLLARAVKKLVLSELFVNMYYKSNKFNKKLSNIINDLMQPSLNYNENCQKIAFVLFIDRLFSLNDILRTKDQSDISSSRIIDPIPSKIRSTDFLKTSEIIEKILTLPSRHPKSFLQSLEHQLNLKFDSSVLISSCNDPYHYLTQTVKFDDSHISYYSTKLHSVSSMREEAYLILLDLVSKSSEEDFSCDDSEILLFNKESELSSFELIYPGDLYSKHQEVFKDIYLIPSPQVLEDWLLTCQNLYKNLQSPAGEETCLLEILSTLILTQASSKSPKNESLLKTAEKIIDSAFFVPADLLVSYLMSFGIAVEKTDLYLAEQKYLSSLFLMTRIYGDPRGRKNIGIPWQMSASWKLSKIARDDKRINDAQLAEEHFDSVKMYTSGFQHDSQKKYCRSSAKQQASIYTSPFDLAREPSWDDILSWIINNSLVMYSSKLLWSQAEVKEYLKLTQLSQLSNQLINTSGASTPSSSKDSKRLNLQLHNSISHSVSLQPHSLNLNSCKGFVYIWGSDTDGQLGISNDSQEATVLMYPRLVTALKDIVINEISAGALHCVANTVDGQCFGWGNNESCQLGLGPDMPRCISMPVHIKALNYIKSAACGYQHTIFLSYSGNLLTAGSGEGGVLGHSNTYSCPYPKTILSMNKIVFSSIQAGGFHSLALTSNGQVFVWGRGEGGQLGLDQDELIKTGDDVYIDCPTRVLSSLAEQRITQIACGEAHNLALSCSGKVFAWGWGSNGQLGNGFREEDFEEGGNLLSIQYTPTPIMAFLVPVKKIAAGGLCSMFLTHNQEVFICGANDKRQLGLEMMTKDVAIPVKIETFDGYPVENIACGESHCVAIGEKVTWTWGNHLDYRLGIGEVGGFSLPMPLQTLSGGSIKKVSCGRIHTMALLGKSEVAQAGGVKEYLSWKIEF